jgi:hypothetical protein
MLAATTARGLGCIAFLAALERRVRLVDDEAYDMNTTYNRYID